MVTIKALYLLSDILTGQYSIEEINGTIGLNDNALVANRCYVKSPFLNENALYFGGFDPNGNIFYKYGMGF